MTGLVDVPAAEPAVPSRWQRARRFVHRWLGFAVTVALLVSATAAYLMGEFDRAQVALLMLIVLQLGGMDNPGGVLVVRIVRRGPK